MKAPDKAAAERAEKGHDERLEMLDELRNLRSEVKNLAARLERA